MAGVHATLDKSQLDKELSAFEQAAKANRALMSTAKDTLLRLIRDTFVDQRDPWGAPWPDWAPSTKKGRERRHDPRKQKLVDTHHLYDSIKGQYDDSSATVQGGAGLDYADVQQFGTSGAGSAHNVRIPPRPFFPSRDPNDDGAFPTAWVSQIFAPIQAALDKQFGGH